MLRLQGHLKEIESIDREIKRNNESNNKLRKTRKELETEVIDILEENGEIGVKYTNNNKTLAVVIESNLRRKPKNPKDVQKATQLILEEHGIEPDVSVSIMKKLDDAKKGSHIDNKKIKIKPYEQGKVKKRKKVKEDINI